MRNLFASLMIGIGSQGSAAGVETAGYLSLSAGETLRSVNNSDSPLTGIYHMGCKVALPSEHWETGFLLEAGIFNRHPALGSVGDIKVHYPLLQEKIRLGLGGGIDLQIYHRGNYRGQFTGSQIYAGRIVPMVIGQIQACKKAFVEYQRNFDETIFWKIRVGYRIWGLE